MTEKKCNSLIYSVKNTSLYGNNFFICQEYGNISATKY